jgi:raffinose/stachyose/melibiose transport system permease protein
VPRGVRARGSRARASAGVAALLLPALLVVALFTLYPLADVLRLALVRWDGFGPQSYVGLDNLRTLAGDQSFRTSLEHSLVWTALAISIPTCLALAVALLLERTAAGGPVSTVLLFPALLPPTVVGSVWLLVLSPSIGLLPALGVGRAPLGDPHAALGALFVAWLWSQLGIAVLLFRAALGMIGAEFYELARAEGAGAFWRLRHITLPGLRRMIGIVLLVNGVLAGAVYDLVYITTGGGPGDATVVLPLDMYNRAFGGLTGEGAAVAAVQIALLVVVALLALAFLAGGESFATGEAGPARPPRAVTPATIVAGVVALASLLPLLWLARAIVLPGRALALGIAGPSLGAVGANLRDALNGGMGGALGTSGLLALAVTAGTLLLAVPAAYALTARVRSRTLHVLVLAALVLAMLQPAPVLIIPLFALLHDLGLLGSAWGVILPEIAQALPVAVLALWAALRALARDPLDAARVDGASSLQSLRYVSLPLARPGLVVAAIWAFVTSWNQYLLPTVVSQDGSLQTVPTVLASFAGAYDTQLGTLAASTLLGLLPTALLYLVARLFARSALMRLWETVR